MATAPAVQQPKANPAAAKVASASPADTAAKAAADATKAPKAERVAEVVAMKDGRSVEFVGKRKLIKSSTIDPAGAVSVRLDFRNGATINFACPPSLLGKAAAHGLEQKLGDETAGTENVEDMVMEVQALADRLAKGEWATTREPNGFAGASDVIRAIMEVRKLVGEEGKAKVQAFIEKKITDLGVSRKALYDSFRNPATETGKIIARLEQERRAGKPAVDASALLAEV